jgi:hypothetical protein
MASISRAEIQDLGRLGELAQEFYAASRFLVTFDLDLFIKFWTGLLTSEMGVIFTLMEGHDIVGVIGGIAHREPYSQAFLAHEFFWFVRKESRGGFGSLALYRRFEKWALEEKRCSSIQMVHLQDSTPEKLKRFYRRLGFEPAETVYVKKLA